MKAQKQFQNRIDAYERQLENISAKIESLTDKIKALQKWQEVFGDEMAAIKDARGGIYDKWYRHHREDNSAYDTQWEIEKGLMLSEGYEGEFRVIEG